LTGETIIYATSCRKIVVFLVASLRNTTGPANQGVTSDEFIGHL
jgi:hypothetical protein